MGVEEEIQCSVDSPIPLVFSLFMTFCEACLSMSGLRSFLSSGDQHA